MYEFILLDSLHKLSNQRSLSAIYHILTGKRSSQSIQDVHLFQLKDYFGIYKTLNAKDFQVHLDNLVRKNMAIYTENGSIITEKGLTLLHQEKLKKETKQLKGLEYDRIADLFFERLTLFIQLSSNILSGEKHFIPVTENLQVQEWTRMLYIKEKKNIKQLFNQLYEELLLFLQLLEEEQASIFVDRLTGYNRYGLSKQQIKDKYNLSYHDVNILMTLIVHKLIYWVEASNTENLVILRKFLLSSDRKLLNTESAEKTFSLLLKGYDIEQIAKIRRLKINTVHDHIIEIAYWDHQFDYTPYLNKNDFENIVHAIGRIGAKQLKKLNEELEGKYSYFQLRLVLAVNESQQGRI